MYFGNGAANYGTEPRWFRRMRQLVVGVPPLMALAAVVACMWGFLSELACGLVVGVMLGFWAAVALVVWLLIRRG